MVDILFQFGANKVTRFSQFSVMKIQKRDRINCIPFASQQSYIYTYTFGYLKLKYAGESRKQQINTCFNEIYLIFSKRQAHKMMRLRANNGVGEYLKWKWK